MKKTTRMILVIGMMFVCSLLLRSDIPADIFTAGDVFPVVGGSCGDGVVDMRDVLEQRRILLQPSEVTACQAENADVPTGRPPRCNCTPDGSISQQDAVTIIDKALERTNCIDYCIDQL